MSSGRFIIKNRELLVYVSIFMYCVAYFMSRVKVPLSQRLIYWTMILAAFLALANVFFDSQFTYKQIIISVVVGVLLLIASWPVRNFEILYLYCLVWGCRNLENDKVIKFITRIMVGMILLTVFLGLLGVADVSVRVTNVTRERYDFGYASWAILPLQYLTVVLFLLYLKRKKIKFTDIILPVIIGLVICVLADVKTGTILLIAGTIGLFLCDKIKIKKWKNLYFLIFLPEVITVVSIIVTKMYGTGKYVFLEKINVVLNNRLMYPVRGLETYGIHLLSNSEFKTVYEDVGYFGIDNSYLYILIAWGILAIIIMLIIYSYVIYYCINKQNIRLLFITVLLICNAFLWNRLLVLIEYEVIVCFSDVFKNKNQQN